MISFRYSLTLYSIIIGSVLSAIFLFLVVLPDEESLIRYDAILGIQTDIDGWFPIDAMGRAFAIGDLTDEKQNALRDKIIKADPKKEALEALNRRDFRLLSTYYQSRIGNGTIHCNRVVFPASRLTIYLGNTRMENAPRGTYWDDIYYNWGKFSTLYNYEILRNSPEGMWSDCSMNSSWAKWN